MLLEKNTMLFISNPPNNCMDSTTIADALAWYMAKTPDPYGRRRKKAGRLFTADSLGEITGINPVTIATFLNKKKRPHERTVEVIRSYLEQEGALREYMAEVMNPVRPPPVTSYRTGDVSGNRDQEYIQALSLRAVIRLAICAVYQSDDDSARRPGSRTFEAALCAEFS